MPLHNKQSNVRSEMDNDNKMDTTGATLGLYCIARFFPQCTFIIHLLHQLMTNAQVILLLLATDEVLLLFQMMQLL